MGLISLILEVLKKPSLWDVFFELMLLTVPLWIAVFVGVFLGWAWRPKWAVFNEEGESKLSNESSCSSANAKGLNSIHSLISFKSLFPSFLPGNVSVNLKDGNFIEQPCVLKSNFSLSEHERNVPSAVNEADLKHLYQLVEEKDGGPAWIHMMNRSTPTMTYQAWRRDPPTGPPQYRSRTIFEDSTPEMVRDFFWDDDFRSKWDDMLIHHAMLEEYQPTGTMIVHWTRKFPFFCSDREYVIARRIWESEGSYYCITKGVPFTSLPRRDKPRRVDLYYSSWCIRAVESPKRPGHMTSCEVLLFHHEDMGIPWEIAKFGVRQGMWGAVKKIDPGLRTYQIERSAGASLSRYALMAHINTRVSTDYLEAANGNLPIENHDDTDANSSEKPGITIPRALVVSGAIALACTIDRGLLTKAVIFGVARRFARVGRKM
ncbi:uncharacterized protein LOC130801537 [Amaranthus tricolor]|uniref:uncharacterized protein LOC130801537 n=1 Tax=Amaranthus tricolor TaxID=29722 RepID=UPI00258C4A44|nr:uncharacterized protein LOC130801537 [Amaranthus tricolor]